jgi:peptidoglycan biosynthesis protein MviN/MurJ (putative lipid II flippase)
MTSMISAFLLYQLYSKGFKGAAPRRLWPFIARCFLCMSVLMIVVLALNRLPIDPQGKFWQLAWYGVRALIGFLVFLITAWVLRMPESRQTLERIERFYSRIKRWIHPTAQA